MAEFAQRLRDSVSEEMVEALAATHPETSNVVRLMTIHQAKGLEFPLVIVADMDRPNRGPSSGAVYHREFGPLLPHRRPGRMKPGTWRSRCIGTSRSAKTRPSRCAVLYVALTCAADHLILSGTLEANGRPRSQWMKLIAERFDLQTGLPKHDPYFGTALKSPTGADGIPQIYVHHAIPARSSGTRGRASRRLCAIPRDH